MKFETFREQEKVGWHDRSEVYADLTARATTQAIPALLVGVRVHVEQRLIDICTGPGFAAGAAAAIGADSVGVDFATGMVEIARKSFPEIRFEEGDALALKFADSEFDAAVCNFGVFHFVDPEAAFSEAFRILKPGGRYSFSQWCAPSESPLFARVFGTIVKHADMSLVPPSPDAFVFSDRGQCRDSLAAAGFTEIEFIEVPSVFRAPSEDFFTYFMSFSVRVPIIMEHQSTKIVQAIEQEINYTMKEFDTGNGLLIPMPSFVVSGLKPG